MLHLVPVAPKRDVLLTKLRKSPNKSSRSALRRKTWSQRGRQSNDGVTMSHRNYEYLMWYNKNRWHDMLSHFIYKITYYILHPWHHLLTFGSKPLTSCISENMSLGRSLGCFFLRHLVADSKVDLNWLGSNIIQYVLFYRYAIVALRIDKTNVKDQRKYIYIYIIYKI